MLMNEPGTSTYIVGTKLKKMMKIFTLLVLNIAFTAISTTTMLASRADMATYRLPVEDLGITLEPSKPGEPYFEYDGRGIRQGIISKVGKTYYMFYDGYGNQTGELDVNAPEKYLCRALLAKSTDLKTWEKLGPKLTTGYDFDPKSSAAVYKDFWNSVSAWTYFNEEEDFWYLFYVGAEEVAKGDENVGVGGGYYSTMVAKAKTKGIMGIEGDWQQLNQLPGQGKAVALYDRPNSELTSSAGSVIQNPKWQGEGDAINKRYMMFVTRGDQVWLARSNILGGVHDWDKSPNPDGWNLDRQILDKTGKTAPENASIAYDEKTGWYFLFTNQFSKCYTHTDCNMVYWSKDPNEWNPKNCATIIDRTTSKNGWATGAIGMASAVRISDDTFAVVYDASLNGSLGHPNRVIAMSHWKIPNLAEDGTVIGYVPEKIINNTGSAIAYTGNFTYDNGGGSELCIQGDQHYSNVAGDSIEFRFEGSSIKWIGTKSPNRGKAEVFINNVSQGIIDSHDAEALHRQILFEKKNTEKGKHVIKIVCQGDGYVGLDAFIID